MRRLAQLWTAVNERLDSPIMTEEKQFIAMEKLEAEFLDEDYPVEPHVEAISRIIRNLRTAGVSRVVTANPKRDSRWELLSDLHEAAHHAPLPAIQVSLIGPVGFATGATPPEPLHVTLRFDHRICARDMQEAIRQLWPQLQERRMLRRTSRLSDRTIELIRHVCLRKPLKSSWRERWTDWNARWTHRRGWRFKDHRAFTSLFYRGEEELTGRRAGLAWYYEPMARLSAQELKQLADEGNQSAIRLVQARRDEGLASIAKAGIELKGSLKRLLEGAEA